MKNPHRMPQTRLPIAEGALSSVYPRLRRMAAMCLAAQPHGQTLQPTALVHEAWLRLAAHTTKTWWGDSSKLVAATTKTMRRILIDKARQRDELKRGGEWVRVPLEEAEQVARRENEELLMIHEALGRLQRVNPAYADVVQMKIFGGMTNQEIAGELQVNERTVNRYWLHAKAWLYEEMLGEH